MLNLHLGFSLFSDATYVEACQRVLGDQRAAQSDVCWGRPG